MQKRILSMILSLSIVASLFAGLTFSVSAAPASSTAFKDVQGNNVYHRNTEITKVASDASWDVDPAESLVRTLNPGKVYYYISERDDANSYLGANSKIVYGKRTEITGATTTLSNLTNDDFSDDARIVPDMVLQRGMFVTYSEGVNATSTSTPADLIDSEEKQYIQVNYELNAEASIESFFFGTNKGTSSIKYMPGHWKVYIGSTEDDLFLETNCVSEYNTVDGTNYRVSKTELATAKVGKWIGLRIICPYHEKPTLARDSMYIRMSHFGVHGTYVTPASTDGVTAVGSNDNGESEAKAVATLTRNTDKNGAYPSTTVKLTANEKYKGSNSKIYTFEGWYLGEEKIADTATANYTLTGAETTKEFTAKYTEKEYEEYNGKYTVQGTHGPGLFSTYAVDKSLLVNKTPISAKLFNKIDEGTDKIPVSDEPQDFELNKQVSVITSYKTNDDGSTVPINSEAYIFSETMMQRRLFVETDANGNQKEPYITDSEKLQWVQLNYALDGDVDIDNVLFGNAAWSTQWAPSHFKLIFSDTEEGLSTLSEAEAVIEVNGNAEGAKQKGAFWNITLTDDITAKYIGVRIIAMYNLDYYGTGKWPTTSTIYPRMNHFGVYGTYVAPVEKVATVTATTEDEALKDLVSVSDVVYGNPDKNGDYASAKVTVKAEATYSDDAYDYTFAGWYKDGVEYTDAAEFVYDATKGDADFVAKYDQTKKIIYHTVSVWWWGTNHVGDYQVAHDEVFDISIAIEDAKAKWPERFTDGKRIVFDEYKNTPITANTTIQGRQENRARFFEKDGKTMIGEEVWFNALGGKPKAPAAPAVEGYTFTGWDNEINSETRDYVAQYEINKFTVTFMAEGEVLKTETVDWNEAATAPTAPAKYGYTFKEWDKEFANVVADIEVNAVYDFTGIIVKFESITGKLLGEVIVEQGDVPSDVPEVLAQIQAINAKVENVYGYSIKRNESGDVAWSDNVYGNAIVVDIAVRPEYVADENVTTNVYVEDVDGAVLINEKARYDSAVTLVSKQNATYWTDAKENGAVVLGAESGTLYACGSDMKIYAQIGTFDKKEVTIVGKTHKEGEGFSVFAHVNVEGATEFGIIFASSNFYNEKPNFDIKDVTKEGETPVRVVNVEVETAKVEGKADFMTTLNYAAEKPNPTRYARAYVVVDGQYYYSDVICNK